MNNKTNERRLSPLVQSIKSVRDNVIEGYGVLFNKEDLVGETFTVDTDYGLDRSLKGMPVYYDHTLTGINSQIGKVKSYSFEDDGILFEIELDKHHQYIKDIQRLVNAKALGLSTGTSGHLVIVEDGVIKRWVINEVSLTPTPAQYENMLKSLKKGEWELSMNEEYNEVNNGVNEVNNEFTNEVKETSEVKEVKETNVDIEAIKADIAAQFNQQFSDIAEQNERLQEELNTIKSNAKPVRHTDSSNKVLSEVNERERDKSLGDFLYAVAAKNVNKLAKRYPSSLKGMNTGTGSEGGYAVPTEYVEQIMRATETNGVIEKYARKFPMTRNTIEIPVSDHTYTHSTGNTNYSAGVTFTSVAEGDALTETQPKMKMITLKANKQVALIPMTNELNDDAIAILESYITQLVTEGLAFKKDYLFLQGSGVGEPLGILSSDAYKEVDLTAASPTVVEFAKMRSALIASSTKNACWVINPTLSWTIVGLDNDAVSYTNIRDMPVMTLFGLPVLESTAMPATIASGGIMLADLRYYVIGQKASLDVAYSEHADFSNDGVMWRFVWRGDGQPWLNAPIPIDDSNTVSAFVVSSTS